MKTSDIFWIFFCPNHSLSNKNIFLFEQSSWIGNTIGYNLNFSAPSSPFSGIGNTTKGEDIIDRVLRRYGIQQTAAIVPGFGCGSSLPPMPTSLKSLMSSSDKNASKKTGLNDSTGKDGSFSSVVKTEKNASKAEDILQSDNITPRSLALLAQLKDEISQ